MKLLSVGNPKLMKGEKKGYLSFVLHLSPADVSGYETCPKRTAGCTAACLNTAGRGGMFKPGGTNTIQEARKRKTRMFFENRVQFLAQLSVDIEKGIKQAEKKGMIPAFRLNGTSDIAWEKYEVIGGKNIFQMFPEVQFYDYTKIRERSVFKDTLPNRYVVTFSRSEDNEHEALDVLANGGIVAVVFDKLPDTWHGYPVVGGDERDDLMLDIEGGTVLGLKAKGRAKRDQSGFVIKTK